MRKLASILALIVLTTVVCAQEVTPDPRITDAFGQEKVDELMQTNTDLVEYYNYYLQNAFFFSEPQGKSVENSIDILNVKSLDDPSGYFDQDINSLCMENFNPLKFDFQPDFHAYTHYRLGETGRYIVFKPVKIFVEEYSNYKENK